MEPHREIWDLTHKNHTSQRIKTSLWTKIAKEADCQKLQAKNKWANLVTLFKEEYAKQNINLPSGASPPPSTWEFYDAMSFMIPAIQMNITGNINVAGNNQPINQPNNEVANQPMNEAINQPANQATIQVVSVQSDQSLENVPNATNAGDIAIQVQNLDSVADWKFLESLDHYMDKIQDEQIKYQFCLESLCLLFNFMKPDQPSTDDEHCADWNNVKMEERSVVNNDNNGKMNKKTPMTRDKNHLENLLSEEMEVESADPYLSNRIGEQLELDNRTVSYQLELDNEREQFYPDCGTIKDQLERDNERDQFYPDNGRSNDQFELDWGRIDHNEDDDDIIFIGEVEPVKKKRKIEIKPSENLRKMLINPFLMKKEPKFK